MIRKRRSIAVVVVGLFVAAGLFWYRTGPGVDGPVIYSRYSFFSDGDDAQVAGVVSLVQGCLLLVNTENESIASGAIWPFGTQWQESPPAVILPDGRIAAVGETVWGTGGYYEISRVGRWVSGAGVAATSECHAIQQDLAVFNPRGDIVVLD